MYFLRPLEAPSEDISKATQSDQLNSESSDQTTYRISQEESKVEFRIDEILREKPFTAVGTSNQIAGDFVIKNTGAPLVTIGTIKVDARTFKTDSENRDTAINRFIVKTETAGNEYITFTPTKINNLPASITKGMPFTFTVEGNMTMSGITKPQTMTITMTQTDDKLSGTVDVNLKRSDYNLTIPSVPFVASVSDTFTVKTTFVANKVNY